MRLACTAVPLLLWASSAAATDLSGDLGAVSDYRYRGVSLSREHPAAQASLTLEHGSGLYANIWGSTLGHRSEFEVDLTAGYAAELSQHVSLDLSGTWYAYPSGGGDDYLEATGIATVTRGQESASLGVSYAPSQRATRSEDGRRHDNAYLFGTAEYALPEAPVTLKAGLGYERGAFDEVERGGKLDWSIGGEVEIKPAKLSLAYVGSNADGDDRHALVASAFLEW